MRSFCCILVLLGSNLLGGQLQDSRVRSECDRAVSGCDAGANRVLERPTGVINGRNGIFTLSRMPAEGTPISVFKTGFPMKQGDDYMLVGNKVVFIGPSIPGPTDVINVAYYPANRTSAKRQLEAEVSHPDSAASGGSITDQYLRSALQSEVDQFTGRAKDPSVVGEAKSLKMIREGGDMGTRSVNQQVAGFDGLGDSAIPLQPQSSRGTFGTPGSSGSKALEMLEAGHNGKGQDTPR